MEEGASFSGDILSQHSFGEAMRAASRLFAACDTKWPDFLLPTAQRQLVDDLLRLCLHLRRVSEASSKKIDRQIKGHSLGMTRDFSKHQGDLWTAINRVVHHHSLEPVLFTDANFFASGNEVMAGHLIADVEVTSDRGTCLINIAGLAIACTNELGKQSLTPKKVFD